MSVLGIDVGAGATKFGIFSDGGELLLPVLLEPPHRGLLEPLYSAEEPTARSYPELLAQLLGITARLKRSHKVEAVGIGVPGFISLTERVIERSPNMRFLDGASLERDLAAAIGLPVTVENDANAAALGEFLALEAGGAGSAPTSRSRWTGEPLPDPFVFLTLGSGIGSGIVLDGCIFHGAGGFAGELGHLLVNSEGRPCGCGNSGCAETESSEAGIVTSYQEFSGDPSPIRSKEVFARLRQGDEAARQAFQRAGSFLGVLLAQIVYSFNPGRISIGGGVAAAGDALLGPAREELARRVIPRVLACTAIAAARLGNEAGKAGAAALATGLLPPGPTGPGRRGPHGPSSRRSGAGRPPGPTGPGP